MAPHFDEYGGDEWICQICGKIQNSRVPCEWRPDITELKAAGNVCPICLKAQATLKLTGASLRAALARKREDEGPISVYEHCRRESGLTGAELTRYVNRHYGFG
jgi:hypothetical protein